ncbi:mucin-binding protein [Lacticaseibacillus absianus]|uniref:mucin-binding protein n=1 Tax=Lacticaseibacillus absianus TaxID=2729623 RepID=UPI001FE93C21|nr:LPXTG cell wall anchor domain-containing protein [Lacticaseibacillus absianus]
MDEQQGKTYTIELKHKHTTSEQTLTTTRTINYQYQDGTKAADSVEQPLTWQLQSDTDDVLSFAAAGTGSLSYQQTGTGFLAAELDDNGEPVLSNGELVPATGDAYDIRYDDAKAKATTTVRTPETASYPEQDAAIVKYATPDKTSTAEASAVDADGNPTDLTDTITYTPVTRTPVTNPADSDLKKVVTETVNYVDAAGNVLRTNKNVSQVAFYRTATGATDGAWIYTDWTTQQDGVSRSADDQQGVMQALNQGYFANPEGLKATYLNTAIDGTETAKTNDDVTLNGQDANTEVVRTIQWTPVTYTPANNPNNLVLTHTVTEVDTYGGPVNTTATKIVATFYRTATLKDASADPTVADNYSYSGWTTNADGVSTSDDTSVTVGAADDKTPTGYTMSATSQVDDGEVAADNQALTVTADNSTVARDFTYAKMTGTVNVHYVYQGATGVKLLPDETITGEYGDDYVPDLQAYIAGFSKYGDGQTTITDIDGNALSDGDGALDTTKLHFVAIDDTYGYQINGVQDGTGVDAEFNSDGQDVWLIFDAEPKGGTATAGDTVKVAKFTDANGDGHTLITTIGGTDGKIKQVVVNDGRAGTNGTNGVDGADGANGDTIQTQRFTDDNGDQHTLIVTISGTDGSIHTQVINDGKDGSTLTTAPVKDTQGNVVGYTILVDGTPSGTILNGVKGDQGDDGQTPVFTPTTDENGNVTGYTVTLDGNPVAEIKNGVDGKTPVITTVPLLDETGNAIGTTVTITTPGADEAPQVFNITNGQDGKTPEVVDNGDGTFSLTIDGKPVATLKNGTDGKDGSTVTTTPIKDANGDVIGYTILVDGKPSGTILNGLNGQDGAPGKNGADGVSPVITPATDDAGNVIGYTITVDGKEVGELKNGRDGVDGEDGKTPIFTPITDQDGRIIGYNITTDGKTVATVMNGQDGEDGKTPVITTTPELDQAGNPVGTIITVTTPGSDEAPQVITVHNGTDGRDGVDGQTPQVKAVTNEDGTTAYEFYITNDDGSETPVGTVAAPKDGKTPTVAPDYDTDGNVDGWIFTLNGVDYIVKNGVDGQNGTDGRNGIDGRDGTDGQDGRDGADGQDGQDGADGQDGQDGADGQDGQDGADGKDGQDGADGKDGQDGADGQDGRDGTDGRDGQDGTDGKDGQDGADGQDSQDGADGKDGQDGTDGQDGRDGTDGRDGQDGSTENTNININVNINHNDGDDQATTDEDQDGDIVINNGGHIIIINNGNTDNSGNDGGNTDNNGNDGGNTDNNGNDGGNTDNNGNDGDNTDNDGNDGDNTDNNGNDGDNNGNDGDTTLTPIRNVVGTGTDTLTDLSNTGTDNEQITPQPTIAAAVGDQTALYRQKTRQLPQTGDQASPKLAMYGVGLTIATAITAFGVARRKRQDEDGDSLY